MPASVFEGWPWLGCKQFRLAGCLLGYVLSGSFEILGIGSWSPDEHMALGTSLGQGCAVDWPVVKVGCVPLLSREQKVRARHGDCSVVVLHLPLCLPSEDCLRVL